MKKIVVVALVIIAIVVAADLYKKYRIAPTLKFETLELTDLNGNVVSLKDYQGKKVFLNFFQTWCGPCLAEFPALDNVAETLAPENFIFITISDEPLPLLNRVRQHFNPNHLIILHSVKPLKDLQVVTYPTNYLLNAKHQVVYEKTGAENWAQPEIIQSLKQKAQ